MFNSWPAPKTLTCVDQVNIVCNVVIIIYMNTSVSIN